MFSNSKLALVEHLLSSANHTALDQSAHENPRCRRLNPNLGSSGEMWLEVLIAAPAAALNLAFVSCPAGISVQFDGALVIHLLSFISQSKLTAILAISRWICNIYFGKEKELRRLPGCPAVIILPTLQNAGGDFEDVKQIEDYINFLLIC